MIEYIVKLGDREVKVSKIDTDRYIASFKDDENLSITGNKYRWNLHREESNDQFYNIEVYVEGKDKYFRYSNEDKSNRPSKISELYGCHKFIIDDVEMIENLEKAIKEMELSPEMREQLLKDRMLELIKRMEKLKEDKNEIAKQEAEVIKEKEDILNELSLLKSQKGKDDKEERSI